MNFDTQPSALPSRRLFLAGACAMAAATFASPDFANAQATPANGAKKVTVGMVLYENFQLLDVFGPLEMFGDFDGPVSLVLLAQKTGPVVSTSGPMAIATSTLNAAPPLDALMIPGGRGTWPSVENASFIAECRGLALKTPHVASICTGAAILARAGLLDGRKATTNKRAFAWVKSQGPKTTWVPRARWVEDGKYFTSSGVSAGTDMSLALIARMFGPEAAKTAAKNAEYVWNSDPDNDPFAIKA